MENTMADISALLSNLERSTTAVEHAVTLPPECFTSEDFYEFELDAIWAREWFCVGHRDSVPEPGDFYSVTVGHEPLIVSHTKGGEITVISAVCQHRGMVVTSSSGNAQLLRCPYHWWTYGLDGSLLGAPDTSDLPDFDKAELGLPRLRSELWNGLIFATFDETSPPIGARLHGLGEFLENYEMENLHLARPLTLTEKPWNWKTQGTECYHCARLHSETWDQYYPVRVDNIDSHGPYNDVSNGVITYDLVSDHLDAAANPTAKVFHPVLPRLTDHERQRQHYVFIAPNLILNAYPDMVQILFWLPTGPETVIGTAGQLFPRTTIDRSEFNELYEAERAQSQRVFDEDFVAFSQSQRGLRSRFANRGRYARSEEVIVRFNRWLTERYRASSLRA
jgi:phenylpropionate dioxygenase-like ring-hydroxylating dioxygenase large terminal subunit